MIGEVPRHAVPDGVPFDARDLSTGTLLATYSAILAELQSRGVVRSGNAPAADVAEHLVAQLFQGS